MNFKVVSLGCKVNSYESEVLINDLQKKGWNFIVDYITPIDVIIINTCTVTQTSDQKSRQIIRSTRRKFPKACIVAMGCFVQLNPEVASNLADVVIGTNNRMKTFELVNEYFAKKNPISIVDDIMNVKTYEEMKLEAVTTHTRGFVKIQDGCENYCSYCAIPYSRGKIRSRQPLDVIEEINSLVNHGTKEVIIAGINTGTYGQDLQNINLATLIEMIMEKTNLFRLRLSSIELMEVTDELLKTLKKYENRIAMHLHIPLQGGSDTVLKRMKRKYLTADYENLIQKVRGIFPHIAITTDLLAGFVGETEEEFAQTKAFIQKIGFAGMHIFPYSKRKNTKAYDMIGHLDPSVIKKRAHELAAIAKKMEKAYLLKVKDLTYEVITEQLKGDYYTAHTSNYLEVYIPKRPKMKENMILKIKIEQITDKIIGKECENE